MGEAGLHSLVLGIFREASQHVHHLVKGMAEGRSLNIARTWGKPLSAGVTAATISTYRTLLSCKFIRSIEECLLARDGAYGQRGQGGCWEEEGWGRWRRKR